MERSHSDVLIAGLILVGSIALGGTFTHAFELPEAVKPIPWFIAAFIAGHVARRVLADLSVEETGVAAAVTIAIVMGIGYQIKDRAPTLEIMLRIGVALAGAVGGAFTARNKQSGRWWLVLAAGTGAFGAGVLAAGITMVATSNSAARGLGVLVGAFAGALVIAFYTAARGRHAAVGLAIPCCFLAGANAHHGDMMSGGIGGFIVGLAIGGAGGALGAKLRRRRKPELPEARVTDS